MEVPDETVAYAVRVCFEFNADRDEGRPSFSLRFKGV